MKENVLKCKVEEFLNRAVKLSEIETDKGKEYWKGQINILNVILSFIDTLEVKEVQNSTAAGMAEEIIINLKRVENDYHIDLTKQMEWLRKIVKKGEKV